MPPPIWRSSISPAATRKSLWGRLRQRSQLHGEVDLRGGRYQDAELLGLHAVVRRHSVASLCSADHPFPAVKEVRLGVQSVAQALPHSVQSSRSSQEARPAKL